MTERTGSWTARQREGLQDAQFLAAERVRELRQLPYAALLNAAEVQELTDLSGERLVRRTTVRRFERGGQEELRVTVRVDDGSRLGRLDPLAEDAVIATPDGQVVGDSTLASVGKRPPPLPAAPRRVLSRSQRGGRVEP